MQAEIDQPDLITDRALRVPHQLAEGFQVAERDLDKLIAQIQQHKKVTDDQTVTINKLLKRVDALEKEQKQLVDINKKLTEQVKKNSKALKEQGDAMEALDTRVGGAITRFKQLGTELLAIAKSPVVIALALIIGTIVALTNAVKTFWTSTGEGEDVAARQSAVWGQFFNTLKVGWSSIGDSISDFIEEGGGAAGIINSILENAKIAFPFLASWLSTLQVEFNRTADDAEKLADVLDALDEDLMRNIIRRSKINLQTAELEHKALQELIYTDRQRLAFLEESVKIKEKQSQVEMSLAKRQYDALLTQIGLEHNLEADQSKRLTEEARLKKFTAEENKQLAEAMARVIDAEAAYYAEVRKNTTKILALKEQIYKKDLDHAMKGAAARVQAAKNELDEQSESSIN
jgi:hypothetical protein